MTSVIAPPKLPRIGARASLSCLPAVEGEAGYGRVDEAGEVAWSGRGEFEKKDRRLP